MFEYLFISKILMLNDQYNNNQDFKINQNLKLKQKIKFSSYDDQKNRNIKIHLKVMFRSMRNKIYSDISTYDMAKEYLT